jgi:hypothetical protein
MKLRLVHWFEFRISTPVALRFHRQSVRKSYPLRLEQRENDRDVLSFCTRRQIVL